MKNSILAYRRPFVIVFHALATIVSNYAAFLLRFDFVVSDQHWASFILALPILLLLRGLTYWALRLYEGLWRYASSWDLLKIILAVAVSSTAFAVTVKDILDIRPYPRSIFIIDSALLIMLLGGARLVRRTYRELGRMKNEKRTLVFGAGDAGELIVRDMKSGSFYNVTPVGFIDDDVAKVGQSIRGVKVLGTRADLPRIMREEQPDEVLVAVPSAQPQEMRQIVHSLEPFKVPIKTLPNLRDLLDGKISVNQIRNLAPEDLMKRPVIDLDVRPVRQLVNGRRILITGAGGSIGSELAKQVAGFGPLKLLLVERYENGLFDLGRHLDAHYPNCAYEALIADIADEARIDDVFRSHHPDVVFHAAAHKHVPLMEANPAEAIKNNVRGTRIVAEASIRHGVSEFVLISTDKAVNPSSVMGASKRVCELMIHSMTLDRPRFVGVRFGNVLGSNGSVTRLFSEQIAQGGPVTVTHPEIRRYFMLIPEAVQLVLHAAAAPDEGTIYALEMGEAIRIQDLARNLIRLLGFVPDEEIQIRFVGLRPGEKLSEDLVGDGEVSEESSVPKVLRVRTSAASRPRLWEQIARLERAAMAGLDEDVVKILGEIVPTFAQASVEPARPSPERAVKVQAG